MKRLVCILLTAIVFVAVQAREQDSGNASSTFGYIGLASDGNTSIDDSISLYTLPSARNRSYLVGLRATPDGPNICLGALVQRRFVITSNCMVTINKKLSAETGYIDTLHTSDYNIAYASIGNRYRSGTKYGEVIPI